MHNIESLSDLVIRLDERVKGLESEIRGDGRRKGLLELLECKFDEAIGELQHLRQSDMKLIDERHAENLARFEALEKWLNACKKWFFIAIGFLAAWTSATGTGTVTLHNLFKVLGWSQ